MKIIFQLPKEDQGGLDQPDKGSYPKGEPTVPLIKYLEYVCQNKLMDDITIHPNKYIISTTRPRKKHFIFDVDETLGSFSDLYILWKGIQQKDKNKKNNLMSKVIFNQLLNLYPEFLRYGITTILEYLYHKKKKNQCGNVYIYTNNQCEPPWIELIISYFETQFGLNGLFEKPICAFKINNKHNNSCRTSHEKNYRDFLNCTLISKNIELCFIDDTFFPKMHNDQIFYIQPKSYHHSLSVDEIIRRFIESKIIEEPFISANFLKEWFSKHPSLKKTTRSRLEKEIDIEISRKLMSNIREFFYLILKKDKTKRNRPFKSKRRFTRKKIRF